MCSPAWTNSESSQCFFTLATSPTLQRGGSCTASGPQGAHWWNLFCFVVWKKSWWWFLYANVEVLLRCMEEFFKQGDKEQEQGLDFSPLCDRQNTMVPQSQIGKRSWKIWCLSHRWLDGWLKLKYSQRSNNYDQNVCSMTLYCFFFDWYCHKLLVWGKYSSVHYNITRLESPFTLFIQ